MSRFKVASIFLTLDSTANPIRTVEAIEKYYDHQGCVVSLKALCGDMVIVTLCHETVVTRVRAEDTIVIENRPHKYKIVDAVCSCVRVPMQHGNVGYGDLNKALRGFGTIHCSEMVSGEGSPVPQFYAMMDVKKDIPARLKIKNQFFSVIEVN